MKVFVYRNLHKNQWSVRAEEGREKGLVIAHCKAIELKDATPHVSEAGRQRVIREQCKNVHAGIYGTWDFAIDATMYHGHDHCRTSRIGAMLKQAFITLQRSAGF